MGLGHLGQQHQADPAQLLGLDKVAVGREDRVPYPQGIDLGLLMPLQGLIDGQLERPRRNQVSDQLFQQHPADGQG